MEIGYPMWSYLADGYNLFVLRQIGPAIGFEMHWLLEQSHYRWSGEEQMAFSLQLQEMGRCLVLTRSVFSGI